MPVCLPVCMPVCLTSERKGASMQITLFELRTSKRVSWYIQCAYTHRVHTHNAFIPEGKEHAGRCACRQACKHAYAGRHAGMQAGRQACKQLGRHAGMQACMIVCVRAQVYPSCMTGSSSARTVYVCGHDGATPPCTRLCVCVCVRVWVCVCVYNTQIYVSLNWPLSRLSAYILMCAIYIYIYIRPAARRVER